MKRYLLVIEQDEGHGEEESVEMYDCLELVKIAIGEIAGSGRLDCQKTTLKEVFEVDLTNEKLKRLEPTIENMEIILKEVK